MFNQDPTIRELARAGDVSEITVRRYVARGVFAAYRDDRGRWRIRRESNPLECLRARLRDHGGPGGRSLLAPAP